MVQYAPVLFPCAPGQPCPIPNPPAVYPGTTTPFPSSIIEPWSADCTNQKYSIFGSKDGNIYDKHFVAQSLRHNGTTMTGFGIMIGKRGAPNEPLYVGVCQGAPPDDPLNPNSYIEVWSIPSYAIGSANTWYWAVFYFETPLDCSHFMPIVVCSSTCDFDPDTNLGDYVWGACFGVPAGLNAAEHYIPQTLGLTQLPSAEPCQGGGEALHCGWEGVDIVSPWPVICDINDPYTPINTVIVGNYYLCRVSLKNDAVWCNNYTVDTYWDSETTLFECYKDILAGLGGTDTILIAFQMPQMTYGYHNLLVKMRQKPSVPAKIITVFVVGGPYEWVAAPDTVAHFSYTAGTPTPCTNPAGAPGDWYCDGTTKMTCQNGVWAPTYNAPECQTAGCINPSGSPGDFRCLGLDLYQCTDTGWQLYSKNAFECAGCTCGNFNDPTSCEDAQGAMGEQCCFWYQKYLWEPARCHSQMGDILQSYLPFLAVGAGAAILLLALSMPSRKQYVPMHQPSTRKRGTKQ